MWIHVPTGNFWPNNEACSSPSQITEKAHKLSNQTHLYPINLEINRNLSTQFRNLKWQQQEIAYFFLLLFYLPGVEVEVFKNL